EEMQADRKVFSKRTVRPVLPVKECGCIRFRTAKIGPNVSLNTCSAQFLALKCIDQLKGAAQHQTTVTRSGDTDLVERNRIFDLLAQAHDKGRLPNSLGDNLRADTRVTPLSGATCPGGVPLSSGVAIAKLDGASSGRESAKPCTIWAPEFSAISSCQVSSMPSKTVLMPLAANS